MHNCIAIKIIYEADKIIKYLNLITICKIMYNQKEYCNISWQYWKVIVVLRP